MSTGPASESEPTSGLAEIRIVVADDHEVVRSGYSALLNTRSDFTVVGTARDGAEAVRICRETRPDVVLMDVRMPGMDGIEATRLLVGQGAGQGWEAAADPPADPSADSPADPSAGLPGDVPADPSVDGSSVGESGNDRSGGSRGSGQSGSSRGSGLGGGSSGVGRAVGSSGGLQADELSGSDSQAANSHATSSYAANSRAGGSYAGPRILVLTTFDLDEYVYDALRAGASGFLLKDVTAERLFDAVRVVAAGEALIAPSVTRRLISEFAQLRPKPENTASTVALTTLTPRETQVLRLVAEGLSNPEIAARLVVTEETIKTHVSRVLNKLGLRDRTQAVVAAYESGLVVPRAQPSVSNQ